MFDLFRSRQSSVRYLRRSSLGGRPLMALPGPRLRRRRVFSGDPTVLAEVGDEKITAEVRQLARGSAATRFPKAWSSSTADDRPAAGHRKSIAYQAERMGLKVTDEQLARIVQSLRSVL